MPYYLDSIDLATYGIVPGHQPESNISLKGCFDMPARIGDTYYEWADEDGIEPYVEDDEIFFGGRDIYFVGAIFGTRTQINDYLDTFYTAIEAFTDLVTFSTPYGDFDVQVKNVSVEYLDGAANINIVFREPVVDLTGGTLPATGSSENTIDGIPFTSFGFYLSGTKDINSLSEMKEQHFTIDGAEGFQMTTRQGKSFDLNGFLVATNLADYLSKIKALYLLFSSEGTRSVIVNNQDPVECFLKDGFKIAGVYIFE